MYMKTLLKFICSIICYIVFIPCVLLLTICVTWYLLPVFRTTDLGQYILNNFGEQSVFIMTIGSAVASLFFLIMSKLFTVIKKSYLLNLYTHVVTWLLALVICAEAGYSFTTSSIIQTAQIDLDLVRKSGILASVIIMLVYSMLAPKIRVLVNRKIQAYDTAKELNANGRSSVVGVQLLKCFDFICPEIFLLISLCFAFNWDIAIYFIFIICAFILPVIGNIICDKRVKREAKRKEVVQREVLVNEVANAIQKQQE